MKDKHIRARMQMCLELAKLSNCPRRKFGALLLDPVRNQVIGEGYNGGPRSGGDLCGGEFCLRDGVDKGRLRIIADDPEARDTATAVYRVVLELPGNQTLVVGRITGQTAALDLAHKFAEEHPPIKSGTEIQIGCHHAEMNVICNAAAGGVRTMGAWLIVTGEPCMMCAKLIHHAGIVKVMVVQGGYMGSNGIAYFDKHEIEVEYVDGPVDPRVTEL